MYIKWPNDIFIGDSIKIGGLIVNSSYSNGCFNAVVGMIYILKSLLQLFVWFPGPMAKQNAMNFGQCVFSMKELRFGT